MKSYKQFVSEYRLPIGDTLPVNKKGKKKRKTVEVMPKVPDGPRGNENEGNRDDRGK
tara:strand:- start:2445 stop:2615 length:171 start_codon:yes stop_codon:yes gene_type:complete